MGAAYFTRHFQKNLCREINSWLLREEFTRLEAMTEQPLPGYNGRIDILVKHKDDVGYSPSFLAIEFEHVSCPDQIERNYDLFYRWVHGSPYRSGALIHIFSPSVNFSSQRWVALLKKAHIAMAKGKNFFYQFQILNVDNLTKCKQLADNCLNEEIELELRLRTFINLVFDQRTI